MRLIKSHLSNKEVNMNYYNLTGQVNDQDTSAVQTIPPQNLIACAENAVSLLTQALNQILANPLNPANLVNFLLAVTNFTAAVTLSCPLNVVTQLINCINSNGFNNIPGILDCINSTNAETVLRSYITSGSNTVSVCTVDPETGALGACQGAGGSDFNLPYGIAIDAKGQHAYFANYFGGVTVCTIENTGQLSSCRTTGSGFRNSVSITLINLSDNPSAAFAYVVNQSNSISKCNVAADGTLSNCQATGNFFDPSDITFNALNTYAYVTDASLSKVLVCTVDPTTGELSACQDAGGNGFNFPFGITIDKTNANAYIVNRRNSSVLQCTINPDDGTFSSCQLTGSGFSDPTDIALINLSNNPSTAFVYVTNQQNNTVSKCSIAADGALGHCQVVANDFNIPLAITFNG